MVERGRPLETLRSFVRAAPPSAEKCEFCATPVPSAHEHLLDPTRRDIRCACADCALVVSSQEASPWRRMPDRATRLALDLDDTDWASLGLPIEIAFFVKSGVAGRTIALYPSPGGPIESTLPLDSWKELVAKNPVLGTLEPDVEAFLVNRRAGAREYWRLSIDRCFKLVGLVRKNWRGFTGGPALTIELARFFARLEEESGA